MKAKPCLHVVKQAPNNYVNLAMMRTAIQVGLQYTDSVYFLYLQSCVWEDEVKKSVFVPVAVLHVRACDSACVCLWVSNVVTKPAHCGLMGGERICTPSASPYFYRHSVLRALFCSNMQSGFYAKPQIQHAPTYYTAPTL